MTDLATHIAAVSAEARLDVLSDNALLDAKRELAHLHGQIQKELVKREGAEAVADEPASRDDFEFLKRTIFG